MFSIDCSSTHNFHVLHTLLRHISVMHDILNEYEVSKKNKCVLYEEIVVVASHNVVFVVAAGWCVRKSTCENSLR